MNTKPTCAVRGLIPGRGMCGAIIVGGQLCGHSGTCEHQRQDVQRCKCGDRSLSDCPGEWEPGCDLGNNERFAKVHIMTPEEQAAMNRALFKSAKQV